MRHLAIWASMLLCARSKVTDLFLLLRIFWALRYLRYI